MAAARLPAFRPEGWGEESFSAQSPSTNTSRVQGKLLKAKRERTSGLSPFAVRENTGLKGKSTMGAIFVKRQSSSLRVGKPSSANREIPALRNGKTQPGCFASFSNRSNFCKWGSVCLAEIGRASCRERV